MPIRVTTKSGKTILIEENDPRYQSLKELLGNEKRKEYKGRILEFVEPQPAPKPEEEALEPSLAGELLLSAPFGIGQAAVSRALGALVRQPILSRLLQFGSAIPTGILSEAIQSPFRPGHESAGDIAMRGAIGGLVGEAVPQVADLALRGGGFLAGKLAKYVYGIPTSYERAVAQEIPTAMEGAMQAVREDVGAKEVTRRFLDYLQGIRKKAMGLYEQNVQKWKDLGLPKEDFAEGINDVLQGLDEIGNDRLRQYVATELGNLARKKQVTVWDVIKITKNLRDRFYANVQSRALPGESIPVSEYDIMQAAGILRQRLLGRFLRPEEVEELARLDRGYAQVMEKFQGFQQIAGKARVGEDEFQATANLARYTQQNAPQLDEAVGEMAEGIERLGGEADEIIRAWMEQYRHEVLALPTSREIRGEMTMRGAPFMTGYLPGPQSILARALSLAAITPEQAVRSQLGLLPSLLPGGASLSMYPHLLFGTGAVGRGAGFYMGRQINE